MPQPDLLDRYRQLLALEAPAVINAALCERHSQKCGAPDDVPAVCDGAEGVYSDVRVRLEKYDQMLACADFYVSRPAQRPGAGAGPGARSRPAEGEGGGRLTRAHATQRTARGVRERARATNPFHLRWRMAAAGTSRLRQRALSPPPLGPTTAHSTPGQLQQARSGRPVHQARRLHGRGLPQGVQAVRGRVIGRRR